MTNRETPHLRTPEVSQSTLLQFLSPSLRNRVNLIQPHPAVNFIVTPLVISPFFLTIVSYVIGVVDPSGKLRGDVLWGGARVLGLVIFEGCATTLGKVVHSLQVVLVYLWGKEYSKK